MKKLFFSIIVSLFFVNFVHATETTAPLAAVINGNLKVYDSPLPWDNAVQAIKGVNGYTQHAGANGDIDAIFYLKEGAYLVHYSAVTKKWDTQNAKILTNPEVAFKNGKWESTELAKN